MHEGGAEAAEAEAGKERSEAGTVFQNDTRNGQREGLEGVTNEVAGKKRRLRQRVSKELRMSSCTSSESAGLQKSQSEKDPQDGDGGEQQCGRVQQEEVDDNR